MTVAITFITAVVVGYWLGRILPQPSSRSDPENKCPWLDEPYICPLCTPDACPREDTEVDLYD